MESHRVLSSTDKNSAVKVWTYGSNSVSEKKKLLSNDNGKNCCAVVPNPPLLASRPSLQCEEKDLGKNGVVVVEEGSAVLRSAWIQRIIPRVLGDEKVAVYLAGRRVNQTHESLVGFWKKKANFCVGTDVGGSVSAEQRVGGLRSSTEGSIQEDVQGGSSGGADCFLGSRELQWTAASFAAVGSRLEPPATKLADLRQQLGCQSWGHDGANAAGDNNSRRLLFPRVSPSGNLSNAAGAVAAAGLGLQFDHSGGDRGGGGAINWSSPNSNGSKEKDISSSGPSSLPPLSLFAPFKHKKDLRRRKMKCQGSSSSSGKVEAVASMPLLTPLLLPPGYGGKEINAKTDQIAGVTQKMMDHLPSSLTPLYVPSNLLFESMTISSQRSADTGLGFGERLKRSSDLSQVFSPFKSAQDANTHSPCSSKTASLPLELILPLDTNGHDSVKHKDTGAKGKMQPTNDINEQHQKPSGSSANVCSMKLASSTLGSEHGNQSGNQESSREAAEIFRHRSSTARLLCDHQPQDFKTNEVAFEDPNVCRLFNEAGSCGLSPVLPLVVSAPGHQSPFLSKSSCSPVKAVGDGNMVVLEGYQNTATGTSQQKLKGKAQGCNCIVEELHRQELSSEDTEIGNEQTREQERGSGTGEVEDVVARKDVDTEQARLGCGALESGCGSGIGFHMLSQEGSRQGGHVAQRNGSCSLLANAADNNRPEGRTSFRKRTRDSSIDFHSPSHILGELDTTPSHGGNVPSAEDKYPKVPKGQPWLHRWMHPSISRSNNSLMPRPASRVSSGSGLRTANKAASNAYASTGTESQEGVAYSRSVQKVLSDATGLASEGERRHPVLSAKNQFAKSERGNVSVGEDHGSKRPFFLGYCNPPSAAAIALVGAASRRSTMALPPQRPSTRVAVWPSTPDTINFLPHALPH